MTRQEIKALLDAGYTRDQILEMPDDIERVGTDGDGIGLKNAARMAIGQGLGFGFGDEIEAAVRAPFDDRDYGAIRDDIRGQLDQARESNPAGSLALEIGGGALTGGAGAARAMGMGAARAAAPSIGRALLTGAGAGAVGGLGAGEGDVGQQLISTAVGAGLGGGLGGAAHMAGKLAGKPARQGGAYMEDLMQGSTPQEMAARVSALGPGSMLGDISPQMRGATAALANRPGPTMDLQTQLAKRSEGMIDMEDEIVRASTGIRGDPTRMKERAIEDMRAQARVDYDDILNLGIAPTKRMESLLDNQPSAARLAERATRVDRQAAGLDWEVPIEDLKNTAGFWDQVGRALDDEAVTSTGQLKKLGAPLLRIKRELDDELLDVTDGRLAQTRARYAESKTGIEAFEDADKFFTQPSSVVLKTIASLNEEQKTLYAAGVTKRIMEQLEKSPQAADAARKLVTLPATTRKMKALLGEERYEEWAKRMKGVSEQMQTYQAANFGSRTAPMQMQKAALDSGEGLVQSALAGDPTAMIPGLAQKLFQPKPMSDPVAVMVANALSSGASDVERNLADIIAKGYSPRFTGAAVGAVPGILNQF